MNKKLNFSPVLFIAVLLQSCISDKGEVAQPISGCDTSYYTKEIKPIIDTKCAKSGCHVIGGIAPVSFRTYEILKVYIDAGEVQDRINRIPGTQGFMPKTGTLDSIDLKKINTWIANGYPGCD